MGDVLKGKVCIVTGAGRGIGRGEALALAAEGAKVVVNDLGGAADGTGAAKGPADEVVAEIKKAGGVAVANYDSVTSPEGAERIIKTALDKFGKLDVLVNNAGILRDRMIFNMTPEEWDAVMKVHLYGHFYCARAACIIFRQQRSGRIINTASTSGLGNMGQANYAAAKEGIVGFTRTVARDMGRYGVTCNALYPSAGTRLTLMPELAAAREKRTAAGIAGTTGISTRFEVTNLMPEDVAPVVVWLASDASANVSGYVIHARGGQIALYSIPAPERVIQKKGRWTLDELDAIVPVALTVGLINPAPPAPAKG